jgi:hypothetical protein
MRGSDVSLAIVILSPIACVTYSFLMFGMAVGFTALAIFLGLALLVAAPSLGQRADRRRENKETST